MVCPTGPGPIPRHRSPCRHAPALTFCVAVILVSLGLGPTTAQAQRTIRVPGDATLEQAIDQARDGDTVEISAGTYASPDGGFFVRRGRSITIRAADGAEVILDGGGQNEILRIFGDLGDDPSMLEGLTFRDGLSDRVSWGGALTLDAAEVEIRDCTFEDNRATSSTGGGALRIFGGSSVRLLDSTLRGNQATTRAGAIELVASDLTVRDSVFESNRTNLPGHGANGPGGAIQVLDGRLTVVASHFEGNEAVSAGGAIHATGSWLADPTGASGESSIVSIERSTFVGNRSQPDPCCAVRPGFAGAIYVGDQTGLTIVGSRFDLNVANFGGAIQSQRAVTRIVDSTFRGNLAQSDDSTAGAAGAIYSTSIDFPSGGNDFGAINRRVDSVTIENTLIQGRFGAEDAMAVQGTCILAEGDVNALNGVGGMEQDGTLEDNQGVMVLRDVILADCDVMSHPLGDGVGGALSIALQRLDIEHSLIYGCDALGTNGTGGAMIVFAESRVVIDDSAFVENQAALRGGAIVASGSELVVRDSFFHRNVVSPGDLEPIQQSAGAAIVTIPDTVTGFDATGMVADSTFVENDGVALVDLDFDDGPINTMVYDGNRFFEPRYGGRVFVAPLDTRAGRTPAQLSQVTIRRANGTSTRKSNRPNTQLGTAPADGRLVAAPRRIFTEQPPGQPESTAYLGHGWSGNSATLAGSGLSQRAGHLAAAEGDYALRIDGSAREETSIDAVDPNAGTCSDLDPANLCLGQDRFQVRVDWRNSQGDTGSGQVVPFGTPDSGLFYFFDPDNWELLVKVLNACVVNQRIWVFAAATTDVQYTLTVTDTLTGEVASYFNPLGNAAAAITDTSALSQACETTTTGEPMLDTAFDTAFDTTFETALVPTAVGRTRGTAPSGNRLRGETGSGPDAVCTPTDTAACLAADRFRIEIDWRNGRGETGSGQVVPNVPSSSSGLFYFFDANNWEVLIKVLEGCIFTDHFWVFAAATTDVEYTLRVTDTETGNQVEYFNPLGNAAAAITDTEALRCQ